MQAKPSKIIGPSGVIFRRNAPKASQVAWDDMAVVGGRKSKGESKSRSLQVSFLACFPTHSVATATEWMGHGGVRLQAARDLLLASAVSHPFSRHGDRMDGARRGSSTSSQGSTIGVCGFPPIQSPRRPNGWGTEGFVYKQPGIYYWRLRFPTHSVATATEWMGHGGVRLQAVRDQGTWGLGTRDVGTTGRLRSGLRFACSSSRCGLACPS